MGKCDESGCFCDCSLTRMIKKKAVFLDRDGVLNEVILREGRPYPPKDLSEFVIRSEALPVLSQLKAEGFFLLVVTNQPDIARGTTNAQEVDLLNQALKQTLPIDDIFVCPHDNDDRCACRKPLPGLLFRGRDLYGIDLSQSFMVGDRWRDVEAGQLAGCKTVWMNFGYQEKQPDTYDYETDSLWGVLNFIKECS